MRGSIDTREIELKTVQDAATAAQSACSSLEANSAELQQRLEDRRQVRDNAASAAKRLAASVEVRHRQTVLTIHIFRVLATHIHTAHLTPDT